MTSEKNSLNRAVLIYMALVGFISILSLGTLWILSELSRFEQEAYALRSAYVAQQKANLKHEVDQALEFIRHMQAKTETRLRDSVKSRVYEAYAMAEHIHRIQKGGKSGAEIRAGIRETLRPIRFNAGRGYYFGFTLEGIEILFPLRPELESTSMLEVTGGRGERVVPDMLAVVAERGEGFYEYTWPKPGQDGFFPKIAFVKLFEPIGWVIGTGEYLDDVAADIQAECLEWIASIEFGADGYVFAGQWDGLSLSGPARGQNMYAVEDVNGVKIVQELIQAAKQGGGFVHYVLPRFEGKKHAPKISYAAGVPEWQWYVGSGMYVDEIESEIAARKAELLRQIRTHVRNTLIVLICLLVFIAFVVKFLAGRLRVNLTLFSGFFSRASAEAVAINSDALHFSEFIQLAESANDMLQKQKLAEKALRESEERLKVIIENSPDSFLIHDSEGRILQVNQALCKSLGYAREELLGMTILDIDPSVSPDEVRQSWRSNTGGVGKSFEARHKRKDGTTFPVEVATASVRFNNEVLFFGYSRDITERKQMENERQKYQNQLVQAQKLEAIGTLAGGIAHDFNNLLMTIQGRASLMAYELEPSHPCQEHVEAIMEGTRGATNLTKQLLGIARGGKYEVRPVDINALVLESAKMFGRTKKEIRIHTKLHEPAPVSPVDSRQIEQVLLNLFINSWQAMPQGGELYLETAVVGLDEAYCRPYGIQPGRYTKITVTDTGIGMDKPTQARVFDPFFTTKEKVRGTGLGLASAYGIIKNHSGIITVYSEVGQGTTFSIYLPVSDQQPYAEAREEKELVMDSGTILLVDDEEVVIDVGRAMLEKLGYRVVSAKSGQEAIDAIRHQGDRIDLVILDMIMPGMGGSETFDRIRQLQPVLPVILSSGYSINGQAATIMEKGCNGFIQKPYSIPELSQTIRKVKRECRSQ